MKEDVVMGSEDEAESDDLMFIKEEAGESVKEVVGNENEDDVEDEASKILEDKSAGLE